MNDLLMLWAFLVLQYRSIVHGSLIYLSLTDLKISELRLGLGLDLNYTINRPVNWAWVTQVQTSRISSFFRKYRNQSNEFSSKNGICENFRKKLTFFIVLNQFVLSWRNLSKESDLFQFINLRNPWHFEDGNDIDAKKLAKEAVDRSNGKLIEISLVDKSSNSMKCLRILFCDQVSITGLIEFVRKAPLLEELELCHSPCSGELIEELGISCLQLKCFKLSCIAFRFMRVESDEEPFAIAENMTQLRRLQLFGNKLTNDGLEAILDECTHLEYLDLRRCFNIDLRGDLEKKCVERVKTIRFPNDLCDELMIMSMNLLNKSGW